MDELQKINFEDKTTQKIVDFIISIGIPVEFETIEEDTFLPGILIKNGAIYIDTQKIKYPGDLLHEAGHLATLLPKKRAEVYNDVSKNAGDEMATIAWSYAAAKYLDIDLRILFHDHGYKGDSKWLREHYSSGGERAVPLLQWMGFTSDKTFAVQKGIEPFPYMQRWIREE
jgi:hypothetical protein